MDTVCLALLGFLIECTSLDERNVHYSLPCLQTLLRVQLVIVMQSCVLCLQIRELLIAAKNSQNSRSKSINTSGMIHALKTNII